MNYCLTKRFFRFVLLYRISDDSHRLTNLVLWKVKEMRKINFLSGITLAITCALKSLLMTMSHFRICYIPERHGLSEKRDLNKDPAKHFRKIHNLPENRGLKTTDSMVKHTEGGSPPIINKQLQLGLSKAGSVILLAQVDKVEKKKYLQHLSAVKLLPPPLYLPNYQKNNM